MPQALHNARIFTGDDWFNGAVILEGGKISGLVPTSEVPAGPGCTDLGGGVLAPGFVDVQVNGGGGVLFNARPDLAGLRQLAAAHRRYGTTSLLPTLISDDWARMVAAAAALRAALAAGVPGVRGIHFEGPYLNPARKGVHAETKIRPPDADAVALMGGGDLGAVVVTVAPEMVPPGLIADLTAAGVAVCLGHSAADYDTVRTALAAGARGFTHLFNAMSPLQSRAPGMVGAALDDPESWCGIIADGHHVHDASLRIALAAKPRGKVMLVTDAMPSVGAEDKRFRLYGTEITAAKGRCALADGTLAGSDLDMAGAVRHAVARLGCDLGEALRMAALYPARFLGCDHRIGRIAPGMDADLVLLDDAVQVRATWIDGQVSWVGAPGG